MAGKWTERVSIHPPAVAPRKKKQKREEIQALMTPPSWTQWLDFSSSSILEENYFLVFLCVDVWFKLFASPVTSMLIVVALWKMTPFFTLDRPVFLLLGLFSAALLMSYKHLLKGSYSRCVFTIQRWIVIIHPQKKIQTVISTKIILIYFLFQNPVDRLSCWS